MSARRRRPYRQVARAQATEQTREALLDAANAELASDGFAGTSLEAVASRAGVSKQTALRHFGSKEGLVAALLRRTGSVVPRERADAPPGDVRAAVAGLMRHYENWGEGVLCMLGAEAHVPLMHHITDRSRELHREWVTRMFEPQLSALDARSRDRRVAQLTALCDVYMWKLLRRDMGLARAEVEESLVEMIERLLEEPHSSRLPLPRTAGADAPQTRALPPAR
ncbi:MAG TPA: helix-turn-helix domain-containing protein [Solirubrobacteraceae bacterium]|jgi:AcrR family transcriptional regulator|nr:helix-turn-helix domain-containing protein [Solirubrobacteraceae bacterium]